MAVFLKTLLLPLGERTVTAIIKFNEQFRYSIFLLTRNPSASILPDKASKFCYRQMFVVLNLYILILSIPLCCINML